MGKTSHWLLTELFINPGFNLETRSTAFSFFFRGRLHHAACGSAQYLVCHEVSVAVLKVWLTARVRPPCTNQSLSWRVFPALAFVLLQLVLENQTKHDTALHHPLWWCHIINTPLGPHPAFSSHEATFVCVCASQCVYRAEEWQGMFARH